MLVVRGVKVHEICGREEETKRNENFISGLLPRKLASRAADEAFGDYSHLPRSSTRAVKDEIPSRSDFLRGVLQLR